MATIAMVASGACAILTALTFGGPVWLTFTLVLLWGASILPDSAQFSALVADYSPPEQAGSLLTFQTALGFALTIVTVQFTPLVAAAVRLAAAAGLAGARARLRHRCHAAAAGDAKDR